jgi:hypothetical protein
MSHSSRGRHGAPSAHRWLGRRSRPACGPIVLPAPIPVAEVDDDAVLPSMELPEGHMAQRPESPAVPETPYVGTVLRRPAARYRTDDQIVVTRGIHRDRRGVVESAYGAGHLRVDIDGRTVYLDEDDVELVWRPDGEEFYPAAEVPITVVAHRPDIWTVQDDTLVLDELPLMGGASL